MAHASALRVDGSEWNVEGIGMLPSHALARALEPRAHAASASSPLFPRMLSASALPPSLLPKALAALALSLLTVDGHGMHAPNPKR